MTHIHVRAQQLRNTTQQPAPGAQQRPNPLKGVGVGPVAPQGNGLTFFLEGLPPSPNVMSKKAHWAYRAGARRDWQDRTVQAIGDDWSPMARVRLELVLVATGYVRNDPDNFVASCKPIVDALVVAGVIPGDSFRDVVELSTRCEVGPVKGVRVVVSPVAPQEGSETR